MCIEFKLVRIGDLGKVVTGKTPPTAREEYFGGDYPFITPTDIEGDHRYVETERYLSQESKKAFSNYLLPSGSVCVVCIGATIGKICMTKVPSFTNQQINSIIVDGKKYDNCFVYYLLSTKKEQIKNIAGGAATPIVSKSAFSDIYVEIPKLSIQQKIAAILSAYDDLIENNLRRIKILEEMAQTIYREWFVKFRFPGHEKVRMVDSPLGKIPEGWELRPLESLISEHIGGGWGKEEPIGTYTEPAFVIRGTDIPDARHCNISNIPYRYHTISNLQPRQLTVGDIVFEVSGGSKGQPLGRTLYISSELLSAFGGKRVICASFCKRIKPDVRLYASELLYLSFLEAYGTGEIDRFQVQSTGISNFKWSEYIKQTQRCIPPKALQAAFCRLINPLLSEVGILGLKNRNLRQTRDLLLPKLIPGQLDVSELDIKIPEIERS